MLDSGQKAALATVLLSLFAASASGAVAEDTRKRHSRSNQACDRTGGRKHRIAGEAGEGEADQDQGRP